VFFGNRICRKIAGEPHRQSKPEFSLCPSPGELSFFRAVNFLHLPHSVSIKLQPLTRFTENSTYKSMETGHAKNVANFETITIILAGLGAIYNPNQAPILLAALQTIVRKFSGRAAPGTPKPVQAFENSSSLPPGSVRGQNDCQPNE